LVQLKKLERFNQRRIKNARLLTKGLSNISGITPPYVDENVKHIFHQYTIRVKEKECGLSRNGLGKYLLSKGIETQVYYPMPIYMQPVFQDLSGLGRRGCPYTCQFYGKKTKYAPGLCPEAEAASQEVLSLPVHPSLTDEQLNFILSAIEKISRTEKKRDKIPMK